MNFGKFITAVVPAYNEEARILGSIEPLLKLKLQVIVVDDGSVDNTLAVLKGFLEENTCYKNYVQIIKHKQNKGKVHAMYTGLKKVKTKYVLFWDADLRNIKINKFKKAIEYYFDSKLAENQGMLVFSTYRMFVNKFGMRVVSGQRLLPTVVAKSALDEFKRLPPKPMYGYLAEGLISKYYVKKGIPIQEYILNYDHDLKHQKLGVKGLLQELRMVSVLAFGGFLIYLMLAYTLTKPVKA